MFSPRFLKEFSPTHRCYAVGPFTLDVMQEQGGWTCIDVCDDGLGGVEIAKGSTADEALANGVRALETRQ